MLTLTDEQRELFELGRTAAEKAGSQPAVHGTQLTGKVEWYTPPQYIDAARKVMGSINVDPATSILAQQVVQADKHYTIKTNGINKQWTGTVWLNPPYAAAIIKPFVEKLIGSLQSGETSQAIMLTHCNTDTKWYHRAFQSCSAICQTRGRVRFYDANGTANSPTHGHIFMYFGKRVTKFANVFSQFGSIVVPWSSK